MIYGFTDKQIDILKDLVSKELKKEPAQSRKAKDLEEIQKELNFDLNIDLSDLNFNLLDLEITADDLKELEI